MVRCSTENMLLLLQPLPPPLRPTTPSGDQAGQQRAQGYSIFPSVSSSLTLLSQMW